MPLAARIVLETAATLIALGGLYDVFVPRLPGHLRTLCGQDGQSAGLVRELLRALGGSLIAIGLAVGILAASLPVPTHRTLILVLVLVLPSEGINSYCMRRVGAPFYVPLGFALLALLGVTLAWKG